MASLYKTESWYIDEEGTAHTPTVKFFDDKFEAERQYHLFCAAAATSEYPTHIATLETIDGTRLKKETYNHSTDSTEETAEE